MIVNNIAVANEGNCTIVERPILFSGAMTQAILAGRKTVTRRVIKAHPNTVKIAHNGMGWAQYDDTDFNLGFVKCPYQANRLWVRETWRPALSETHECYAYKADLNYQCGKSIPENNYSTVAWRSPIFMPKAACRLWLEVKGIRAEKLQDITEEGAIAEGIESWEENGQTVYRNYVEGGWLFSAIGSFTSLWESIHGHESWNRNEWVWVVEFKRVGGMV